MTHARHAAKMSGKSKAFYHRGRSVKTNMMRVEYVKNARIGHDPGCCHLAAV